MAERRGVVVHDTDVWWTVIVVDRFAIPLVRLVRNRLWVTPMRLTVAAHLLGVVSAVLLARGELIAGAALFEIRFILDCMDGKLARTRGTSSRAGGYVDFVGDYVIAGLTMSGLGLHLLWHAEVSAVLAFAVPVVFATQIAVRLSVEQLGAMRNVADATPAGYRAWMAKRRLVPAPSRIDVEHGLLFVAPVLAATLDATWPVVTAAGVSVAYFGYVLCRFAWDGYARTRAMDRLAP